MPSKQGGVLCEGYKWIKYLIRYRDKNEKQYSEDNHKCIIQIGQDIIIFFFFLIFAAQENNVDPFTMSRSMICLLT